MASGNGASCMELALEGERMCKNGDCRTGVSYFEAAIQVGTEDLKTLSAVYSQLGNAYFYLQEYEKALEFHRHDLTLARTLGDRLGEAKASGNLGNTLKVLGKFEEAIVCCTRHLDISRELSDKIGEARALYNLGNVYHAKGKHLGRSRYREPGDFPEEVRQSLERAVEFYEANLVLVKELHDKAAEGRAYGNLGNTHYLLGNFDKAVQYHEERLLIARSFNDTAAERRAFSNLGNAHVFLGEFEIAAEYYKKTLEIAMALKDRAIEAQACYSIGNTYTLLKLFDKAADYHQKHLEIAKELSDRVGEGRAYWSLGNAYTALGKHTLALEFAEKHLQISKEVGDRTGELTAEMNISDLKLVLGINDDRKRRAGVLSPNEVKEVFLRENKVADITTNGTEHTNELRVRADGQRALSAGDVRLRVGSALPRVSSLDEGPGDDFFDLIMKAQGGRMNDQRCELPPVNKNHSQSHVPDQSQPPVPPQASGSGELQVPRELGNSTSTEDLFEMVMKMQGDRMEEQRYEMPVLPGLDPKVLRRDDPNIQLVKKKLIGEQSSKKTGVPDDAFLDMLMRCQATRIDDQRCDFPTVPRGPTVPDEDFFNLIIKLQSKRIESQRASFNGP